MLLKQPLFSSIAIITLALGIGANTAIFSIVNSVLLRPLPYSEPHRLMLIERAPLFISNPASRALPPASEWLDWWEQAPSFERIAACGGFSEGVNLTGAGEPERIEATEVTVNFFDAMGVRPVRGRAFLPEEQGPGKTNVAVISHGLWQKRFGADDAALGQTIWLNGKPFTLIGVAPRGMQYPNKVDAWLPIADRSERALSSPVRFYNIIGRLAPRASIDDARGEMRSLSDRIKEQHQGDKSRFEPIQVVPLEQQIVKEIRPALLILLSAVALVLLIACANVANLLLSRAVSRQREVAIRAALGASRWRLARQLMVESVMLALAGGISGLLLAMWGLDSLLALSPAELPRFNDIGLDSQALAFTLTLSVFTGLLFGLLPAMQSSKVNLTESLKESGWQASTGGRSKYARNLLVMAEIALALVLMTGAGLMIRSFVKLQSIDPGFDPKNALTFSLSLPSTKYDTATKRTDFFGQLIERLQAIPGVESVGAANGLPLAESGLVGLFYKIEGQSEDEVPEDQFATYFAISPDYFRSLRIPVIEGRSLTDADHKDAALVVVVNQSFARRHWPTESAVGKRISMSTDKAPREIVGVIGDVKNGGLTEVGSAETYIPYQQAIMPIKAIAVRASLDTASLASAVRAEVAAMDFDLPIYDIRTMEDRVSVHLAKERFMLLLLGLFAALAMTLAAVGIYGVMSHSITQRTHEIGIRLALGAEPRNVLRLMMRHGAMLTFPGILAGAAASIGVTRLMESLLYGVSATDPATLVAVAILLAAVALFACYIPARRATRVDPIVALRYE
jgi:putative ABC transport system permease protein